MTPLRHAGEVPVDESSVQELLRVQRPDWAELPLEAARSGTDNRMYRLGRDLLVRLPRTPAKAVGIVKEQECLPLLAPQLPMEIPRPVFVGAPGPTFPLVWSIYSWLDGVEVGNDTVWDWTAFGIDLARFVRALHATELNGARREGNLRWYRGGHLEETSAWIGGAFASCREIDDLDLDVDRLERMWLASLGLPQSRELTCGSMAT